MSFPRPGRWSRNALSDSSLQLYQSYLDVSTPFPTYRWIGSGVLLFIFFLRIVFAQGWYIGTCRPIQPRGQLRFHNFLRSRPKINAFEKLRDTGLHYKYTRSN